MCKLNTPESRAKAYGKEHVYLLVIAITVRISLHNNRIDQFHSKYLFSAGTHYSNERRMKTIQLIISTQSTRFDPSALKISN